MKVSELMVKLTRCDPQAEVYVAIGDESIVANAARVLTAPDSGNNDEVYICDYTVEIYQGEEVTE